MALFDDEFLRRLDLLRVAFVRRSTADREGDRTRRRPGESPEFAGHRAYSPGDATARVDWNVYARLGELFIKQFDRPATESLVVEIDTSASMAVKFDAARRIAAAMLFTAASGYARVELAAGGRRIVPGSPREGLAFLEGLGARGDGVPALPERGAVALISDFWWEPEPFFRAAAQFRARGGELSLVHLLSREEVEPSLDGPLTLVDAESGERKRLFAGEPEREAYRRALEGYAGSLAAGAAKIDAPYALVRADEPIEKILFERLRAAGILE